MAAGSASKLAEAYVRIRADSTGLKKDLATIKRGLLGSVRLMGRAVSAAFRPVRAMMKTLIGGPLGAAGALLKSPLALLTGGVGVAMIGREAAMFEDAMAKSTAIMGGAQGQMENLRKVARKTAVELGMSHEEIARSYFFLASANLNAAQSMKMLPLMARFAKAGTFDMAMATDMLTDSISALGMASKDPQVLLKNMSWLADMLVKSNTLANASVQQFAESLMFRGATGMKNFNIAVEEGMAVLAVMADKNLAKGSAAGQAFFAILQSMTRGAIMNKKAWKELGIELFDKGRMRGPIEMITLLTDKLGTLSAEAQGKALIDMGINRQALAVMQGLLGTADKMREYRKELENVGGTTERIAQKNMQSFVEVLKRLKATIIDFAITAFTPIFRLLEKGIKPLQAWMQRMSKAMAEFLAQWGPTFTRWAALTVEIVENLWRGLEHVRDTVGGLIQTIRNMAGLAAGAFGGLLDKVSLLTTNLGVARKYIGLLLNELFVKAQLFLTVLHVKIKAFFKTILRTMLELVRRFTQELKAAPWYEQLLGLAPRTAMARTLAPKAVGEAIQEGAKAGREDIERAEIRAEQRRKVNENVTGELRKQLLVKMDLARADERRLKLYRTMDEAGLHIAPFEGPRKVAGKLPAGIEAPPEPAAAARGGFVGLAELSKSIQTALLGGAAEQRAQKQAADIAEIADNTRQTVEGLAAVDAGVFAEGIA